MNIEQTNNMSEQNKVKKLLEELRALLETKNHSKCLDQLEVIAEYFDSPLSTSEYSKCRSLL